ncbi:glucuronate isomerase [Roseospira visakhapatnamensis]|uniref:Uronate isomerase n=1 Tax=Roseospira visakhapatnamensis TaxID=390880 RepID=A0A7W6W884_9PROT|nr:glucuronate isomerase [Roseospira visakhapatnamensis]MBB4264574.1 glucuronate isomerase [Roseospira visakhapatnamensis]
MKAFMGDDFLLESDAACRLYHEVAAPLPIIDYHNHLPPRQIAEDTHWESLGQIWLEGDHYKWRAMRWAGIDERRITGDASFREKFDAFADIMPQCLGNPLYHWTHLEMSRYFGLDGTVLSRDTAAAVWDAAADRLPRPEFGARGLLRRMAVELVGTTDDPCDSLEHHRALAREPDLGFRVVPSFRPDHAVKIEAAGFPAYLERLSAAADMPITRFEDLVAALERRLDHFVAAGCVATDHGIEIARLGAERTDAALTAILKRRLAGHTLDEADIADFQGAVLVALGRAYARRDLVMQLHLGPIRNNRSALVRTLGADVGGDSIGDRPFAAALNALLDRLDRTGDLPRTILYSVDPSRNAVIVTTAGNFQDGSVPGKVQAGSGWWFNDQLDGMRRQMTQLAQMGLIARFVGMLTDSRSFLSFPRHEYFRRLLCDMVGDWMERGHIPPDHDLAAGLVTDICYRNAARWFAAR